MRKLRVLAGGLLAASALWLVGCEGGGSGGKGWITYRPNWEYERYERIAVLPGRATTPEAAQQAGILADRLTTLLTQSGQFRVLSRSELQELFAEQDLSQLADAIDAGTAIPQGRLQAAQALVAVRITDCKLIADREERTMPRYAVDRRGNRLLDRYGQPIIAGYETFYIYRHGAEVEGSVRVIDAATGEILISHAARVAARPRVTRNVPPGVTPEQLAGEAVRELATEFFKAIAPTRMCVNFKGDMLVVARDYYDGHYNTTGKLPRSLSEFIVAVRNLPETCDRNRFRLVVATQDTRQDLFEQEFVWSGSSGPEGVSYRIPLQTLLDSGSEKFVAKLYSVGDPEPKIQRKFTVEKTKGGD